MNDVEATFTTIPRIAAELGLRTPVVRYLVEYRLKIRPIGRAGHVKLFAPGVADLVRSEAGL